MSTKFYVKKVHPLAKLPEKHTSTDSGFDVFACEFKKYYHIDTVFAVQKEKDADFEFVPVDQNKGRPLNFDGSPADILPVEVCIDDENEHLSQLNQFGFMFLEGFERVLVDTGLQIAVEPGYEIQVRSRSGNALKEGISITNSPGTIDSGYRGNVGIILHNTTPVRRKISLGDKIAQLVVMPVELPEIVEVDELPESERGDGGFGSSGKNINETNS